MAGQDWFSGFMQRHKLLSARVQEATSLSRSTSFNKTNVAEFYEKLAEVIDRYKIKGHQIYNVDETGITTVQKPRSIIATKGTKQVGAMTSGERGTLVTTCLAISATGYMVPPILIFPRKKYFKAHVIRDGPTGCIGAANSSGFMIGEHFLEFLMHFHEHTRPSPLNPVILLLDNHNSHVHVHALNYAKQNGIIMLSFPPHCSHKLQPLDRSVFGPWKTYVHTEQDKWIKNNPGKPMTIYDLPGILRTALPRAATPLNISRGFEVAGIFPYNQDVFKDVEFAPSYVTDRPETKQVQNQEVTNNSSASLSQDSRNQKENDSPEVHDTYQGADQTNTADYRPNEWDIIKEHIIKQNLELKDVPGDGHCIMYAVQACMNQEHSENISTEEIIDTLSEEVKTYSQFY